MMGMMMEMSQVQIMDEEDKEITIPEHGYTCRYCGDRHVSDDTETWCAINKYKKDVDMSGSVV